MSTYPSGLLGTDIDTHNNENDHRDDDRDEESVEARHMIFSRSFSFQKFITGPPDEEHETCNQGDEEDCQPHKEHSRDHEIYPGNCYDPFVELGEMRIAGIRYLEGGGDHERDHARDEPYGGVGIGEIQHSGLYQMVADVATNLTRGDPKVGIAFALLPLGLHRTT